MHKDWHLPPIPHGLQIFEERLEIKGVQHYKADATAFAKGKDRCLWFIRDEFNQHDPNAIAIHGAWKGWFFGKQGMLGYVERDAAKAIVEGGWWGRVHPRLLKTYVSDAGFVEILYQILGPKGESKEYHRPGRLIKVKGRRKKQPIIV